MKLICDNCPIAEEKVCDECRSYQACIDNKMDFVTLENAPDNCPDCFECKFKENGRCTADN